MLVTWLINHHNTPLHMTSYAVEVTPEEALNDAKKSFAMSTRPGDKVVVVEVYPVSSDDSDAGIGHEEEFGFAIQSVGRNWLPNQMKPQPKWYNAWGEEVKVDRVRLDWNDLVPEFALRYLPTPKMQEVHPKCYPVKVPPLKEGFEVFPVHIFDKIVRQYPRELLFPKHHYVALMEDKNDLVFREDFKYTGWTPNTEPEDRGKPFPKNSFPGLYPIQYLDMHGQMYCAKFATEVWAKFLSGDMTTRMHEMIHGHETYDEGPALYCCNCNDTIESSYGDPEESTND